MNPEMLRIIFYDGECGLCHRAVNFLYARDRHQKLCFAPLGGNTALRPLPANSAPIANALIYYDRGQFYFRTEAILRLLALLYPFCKVFLILLFVPPIFRDGFYRLIAKHRKKYYPF